MKKGKIIKGIAGFYYVSYEEEIYSCKAKGIFRNKNIKPLVGDDVELEIIDEKKKEGNIISILERKNSLIRPAISNIDEALVVLAVSRPKPQLYLLDKYLIGMAMQNIPVSILFNKIDLDIEKALEYKKTYLKAGHRVFLTSILSERGIKELREHLKDKTTVLAGPSGVGKSTLTNILVPEAKMQTGELSKKIDRGKHTTRHSELFKIDKNTYVCDTPGFTSMDISLVEADDLKGYFPEISAMEGKCRFLGCSHRKEPDCAVKNAVEENIISEERYYNYIKIYEEIHSKRR